MTMKSKMAVLIVAFMFILLITMPMSVADKGSKDSGGSFQCFRYPCFMIKQIGNGNMCEKIYSNGYVERFKCKKK